MPVVCRKCGGDHFTLKCGKEKKKEVKPPEEKKEEKREFKSVKKPRKFIKKKSYNRRSEDNIPNYKVTLSNLPEDITFVNLNKMMLNWGRIGKIDLRFNRKMESNNANIQFYEKEQAEYFVKAIDKTPVGYMMISASLN